jgi:hypothetical protein
MSRFSLALALAALAACTERANPGDSLMKEGDPMPPNTATVRPALPPVDAALPARLETATFAVG